MDEPIHCPFCNYRAENEYGIMYHLEKFHPEGESPFVVQDTFDQPGTFSSVYEASSLVDDDGSSFVDCPRHGCGEAVFLSELDGHMALHDVESNEDNASLPYPSQHKRIADAESESSFDTRLPPALRNLGGQDSSTSSLPSDQQASTKAGWRDLLNMPRSRHASPPSPKASPQLTPKVYRRLGKSELGPYAHEKQMPAWLIKLLEADGQVKTITEPSRLGKPSKVKVIENQVSGVIPVIKQLLDQDISTEYAYTCHQCVQHVSKLDKEGGFCGYRNIQMLVSYINGVQSQGFHHFQGKLPTIFEIQDYIESAWDLGINAQGRLETGGIRGTRKYIGTPEAQAMLISLDIPCNARGLKSKGKVRADELLLQYVEEYFSAGSTHREGKLRSTRLGPLYFQHPGHSLTIIGYEKKKDGSMNLLVFDPIFHDSTSVTKLVNQTFTHRSPGDLLRAYRRSVKYLRRYNEFEVLGLTSPKLESDNATVS